MALGLITLNVGAPSLERARRQLEWLAGRPEDIFVLTETKATPGSQFLAEACAAANYSVTFPEHGPGELGVMIVSKVATTPDPLTGALGYLPARAAGVLVSTADGPLRVLGTYVPSRDATLEKTERKKRWIEGFHTALDTTLSGVPVLLLGDLNVLEPGHQPEHRQQFAPFEYAFYRSLADRRGLLDAFRHLHPHRVEHSWARPDGPRIPLRPRPLLRAAPASAPGLRVRPPNPGRSRGRIAADRSLRTRRAFGHDGEGTAANLGGRHGGTQRARVGANSVLTWLFRADRHLRPARRA